MKQLSKTVQGRNLSFLDVYLFKGTHNLPVLENLEQLAPELKEPVVQQRLMQSSPHFLGLDLDADSAVDLLRYLRYLRNEKATGYIVPVAYQHPRITVEQATLIAERHFKMVKTIERPGDTLGPTHFKGEEPVYWVFGAASEQSLKEDRVPALLFANVDKLDGHIWRKDEFRRLWEGV